MHIFIDESGTFALPEKRGHSISLVGALIIPDSSRDELFRRYERIRPHLRLENGEVKGRLLDERSVARVVDLLIKNGALYEVTAIDMSDHTGAKLADHKLRQAEKLTENLTDEHRPDVHRGVWELRRRLEQMPLQLYAQSAVTFELLGRVVRHATLYFVQRIPKELGAFHWVVDAKDRSRTTNWEDWWSLVVLPALESRSREEPLDILEGADYSHFDRFRMIASDYKTRVLGLKDRKVTNIRAIIRESFRFSSDIEPGLELIDVVASATRRALSGRLGQDGWRYIPRIMINRRGCYVHLINLGPEELWTTGRPYDAVLRHFRRGGRNMLTPSLRAETAPLGARGNAEVPSSPGP